MKKIPILTLTLGLFILTMALAVAQGFAGGPTSQSFSYALQYIEPTFSGGMNLFTQAFTLLVTLLGQNLFISVIVLAFLVEAVLLYPSVAIQLKQKKIHLFHKKLVDRFHSGDLKWSKKKQELDVLYSVNDTLHRRGALLFITQFLVLLWVALGLQQVALYRPETWSALSRFDLMLLAKPENGLLPLLLALAYFLHSVLKIQFKQKEDYLPLSQSRLALVISFLIAIIVFTFSSFMPVLLSVYLIHLITFSTLRYAWVEKNAKAWSKTAHRQLIHLLMHAPSQLSPFQKWRAKWNHSTFVRHFNLHLLEEAASMSLVVGLMVTHF